MSTEIKRPFWVRFEKHHSVCFEAESIDAVREQICEFVDLTHDSVFAVTPLPYPAAPRVGPQSGEPSFCYRPADCAGKSSCTHPNGHACND